MPELDHDAVRLRAAAAAGARFPGAEVTDLRLLPGGLSSLTVAGRLVHETGETAIVLKVAPPGLAPVHHRDVLRQARVLDALVGLPGFPVPAVLFRDAGDPPEVPPLFAMELAAGQAYEPLLDVTDHPPSGGVAAERMRVAARALAVLHRTDPVERGLGDAVVAPVDEVARWTRLLATVEPDIACGHDELARRLVERVPDARPPRVHHGDYRVANMLFVGASLCAVIDWEIWSVGDPRFDLAWLAMHTAPAYRFHARRPPADEAAGGSAPTAEEIVAEYRGAGGDDAVTGDLDWFAAASQYKGVATVAALVKRERRRPDPEPRILTVGSHLDRMLDAGHRALDRRTPHRPPTVNRG